MSFNYAFKKDTINTMYNFLDQSSSKNYEFEIRFGKFNKIKQKDQSVSTFDSNIEINTFYNLKRIFKKQNFKSVISNTIETIFQTQSGKESYKHIEKICNDNVNDNENFVVMKKNIRKYDVYDYDFRMSISEEKQNVKIPQDAKCVLKRSKYRTSFILPFGSLDLTVVEQNYENYSNSKYEVELEISPDISKEMFRMAIDYIVLIIQTRQDNFFITPGLERRQIIQEYKNLVGNNYFIGAQPETLHKDQITKLYKAEYSVTDKADGDRAFVYINSRGLIYIIDNNVNAVSKTDIYSSTYKFCIIDTEIVKHYNKIYFLAFDLICYNNKDLRGNTDYNLKRRLEILTNVIETFSDSNYYKCSVKKYFFGDVFTGSKTILESICNNFYKNDGLIFTPTNEPYPTIKKWSNLLKWKPCDLNTIDFYCKRTDRKSSNGDSIWNLYVQGHSQEKGNSVNNTVSNTILFDIKKLCGSETKTVTYETSFCDSLLDPTTDEQYKTNTVIEFKWDNTNLKFVPIRTRWDKTSNPKKHGNWVSVACDIWNNINNPITQEYLLKFHSSSKNELYNFESAKRFHNKIRENLYNTYCNNVNNLLEFPCGKGLDINKWIYNKVINVTGYDFCDKNIEECKRKVNGKYSNFKFYKLDPDHITLDVAVCKFDVAVCNFGLGSFFKSEKYLSNFIDFLKTSIQEGGYFITSFMDDTNLNNLLSNKNRFLYEKDDIILFSLEYSKIENSSFGNKLKINLSISSENSEEFVVDFKLFCKVMEGAGFKCIETNLFSEIYKNNAFCKTSDKITLSDHERSISFLNRYCVFRKDVSVEFLPVVKQKFVYNNKTNFDFQTIDLHQKNITVQKINSVYDIVDIINCIEYKYYKNEIENVNLVDIPENTFPKIQCAFNNLNIEYTPFFINDPMKFSEYTKSSSIYFTYYKHSIKKQTDSLQKELVEYNNWYIVMYKNNIIFTNPKASETEPLQKNYSQNESYKMEHSETESLQKNYSQKESYEMELLQKKSSEKEPSEKESLQKKSSEKEHSEKESLQKDYTKTKNSGVKLTIKILKEFLQRANLKITGKREELQSRLETFLLS